MNRRLRESVERGIRAVCGYKGCEVVELNVQSDHVHLIMLAPPKVAISEVMGRGKGQTATRLFKQFTELRTKPYWVTISGLRGIAWTR